MKCAEVFNAVIGIAAALVWSAGAHAQNPAFSTTVAGTDQSVAFGSIEARFRLSDAWLLSAGLAYLDPAVAPDETQLRLSAIGSLSVGAWQIENRHLVSVSSVSVERYRARLRIVRPDLFGHVALSLRAYDEAFFDFDTRRFFRNNVAFGFGVQFTSALSGELYEVWEMNRSREDNAYVLALLTYRFGQ